MTEDKKKAIAEKLAILTTYIIKMISDKRVSGEDTSKDEEIIPEIMSELVGEIYSYDRKGLNMVREATDRIVKEAEKNMIKKCKRIAKGISLTDDNNSAQA